MSLFKQLTQSLKDAIDWYKNLPSEKQTTIVVDYFKDANKLSKTEGENFRIIASEISNTLATTSKVEVIKKLTDLGVDDTLSSLIVEKISKNQPSLQSCLLALRDIPDETFDDLVFEVMANFFLDWRQFNHAETAKRTGTNVNLVQSAIILIRDGFVHSNLRGNISIESFKKILLVDWQYPPSKVSAFIKHYEKYKDQLYTSLVFATLQDNSGELQKISQSLSEISLNLKELLQLLKGETKKTYVT
jgi:hypothetical protein